MRITLNILFAFVLLGASRGTRLNAAPEEKPSTRKIPLLKAIYKTNINASEKSLNPPVIEKDEVRWGDKKIIFKGTWGTRLREGGMTLLANGKALLAINYWVSTGIPKGRGISSLRFENKNSSYNDINKTFSYKGTFPFLSEGKKISGVYDRKFSLLEDGTARLSIYCDAKDKTTSFINRCLMLKLPFHLCSGTKIYVDGKEFPFSSMDSPKKNKALVNEGNFMAEELEFFPDNPNLNFKIKFPRKTKIWIREIRENGENMASIRVFPNKTANRTELLLDLRSGIADNKKHSGKNLAGIDFWAADRLETPDYRISKNLMQNSSFESGLRYWTYQTCWGVYQRSNVENIYQTDDSVSRYGKKSLRITTFNNWTQAPYLKSFAIPVRPGKKYTLSFYAKGSIASGQRIHARTITGEWHKFPRLGYAKLGKDWQRYNYSFTAPNSAVSILLRGTNRNRNESEGHIWIDGIQLQEGELTEYTEKPAFMELVTSDKDDFFASDKEINAKMIVYGKPGLKGKIDFELKNFFYEKLWRDTKEFIIDDKGHAEIELPINARIVSGIYILSTALNLENGFSEKDYFRITKIKPLSNTHRNKNIFGIGISFKIPRMPALLERYMQMGFGACSTGVYSRWEFEMLKKYRIEFMGTSMERAISNKREKNGKGRLRDLKEVTPQILENIENDVLEMAKKYPWIDKWALAGECHSFRLLLEGNTRDFVKLLIGAYNTLKKFNPSTKVFLTQGPCNMMPMNGAKYVDEYLTEAEKLAPGLKFDIVAIHPYRTTPEDPDLDDDTKYFLKMLKRHKYQDVPVYWMEGIYYPVYINPAWGLDAHRGCSTDHYRAGAPSYDIGWGEKISSAYYARSWLVALKYQDRIKFFNGWGQGFSYLDAYLTPYCIEKIPNTLGNILGNAAFVKDIRLAPFTRCYVFEDENKCPVAAIWRHHPLEDRGLKAGVEAEIKTVQNLDFIDLMGEKRQVANSDGKYIFPLNSFPLFIRGEAGKTGTFVKSVADTFRIAGENSKPYKISMKLKDRQNVMYCLTSCVSRELKGKILFEGTNKSANFKLKSGETKEFPLKLKKPLKKGRLNNVSITYNILMDNENEYNEKMTSNCIAVQKTETPIVADGKFHEWKEIPEIKITNNKPRKWKREKDKEPIGYKGDCEATYKVAWDNDNFYLLVKVTDDKFVHQKYEGIGRRWANDCVQFYFDSLGDAKSREVKGFDGNDYNYDLFPNDGEGTATVFRRFCPEQQMIGGLFAPKRNTVEKNIKCAFIRKGNTMFYEAVFPAKYLQPFELKTGRIAGMALYIADRDRDSNRKGVGESPVKNGLTTTPQNTAPYTNPHLYPDILLVK